MGTCCFLDSQLEEGPIAVADYNSSLCGSWHLASASSQALWRLQLTQPAALWELLSVLKGLRGGGSGAGWGMLIRNITLWEVTTFFP